MDLIFTSLNLLAICLSLEKSLGPRFSGIICSFADKLQFFRFSEINPLPDACSAIAFSHPEAGVSLLTFPLLY